MLNSLFMLDNSEAEKKIEAVRNLYDQLDLYPLTQEKVRKYYSYAEKHFEQIQVSAERKTELSAFAKKLMKRTF